jgi:hypothetical protein
MSMPYSADPGPGAAPLAKILGGPMSPPVSSLVAAAEGRVASLEHTIAAHVRERAARILSHIRLPDAALHEARRELAAEANGIVDVAGAARLGLIGEVARGLGAALRHESQAERWRAAPIRLHIEALAVAMSGPGADEAALLLSRLKALRARLGVTE